jgi:WD40 repeat protein/tetratricopeptide (TPR) repeat protein
MARCPSREQLTRLLSETLTGPEDALALAHVRTCAACQLVLDGFQEDCPDTTLHAGREVDDLPPAPRSPAWPEVSGYEILGELGRGGMGVVYKARHLKLGRIVALKMLLGGAYAGPHERDRFKTEAAAAARLQHPNIVQIFEVGEEKSCPYLALEYVEDGSLDQCLQGTPLPPWEAALLAQTLARAVHEAHRRGIVHRDLKPANVLLRRKSEIRNPKSESGPPPGISDFGFRISDFEPKIADFGLAKRLDAATVNTQSGMVLGTPDFMAPEQAEGSRSTVGPGADVYALGAILYYLLVGRPPFLAATALDTLMRVRSEEPVAPSVLQPKVPRDLETICLKCLLKSPARRYESAAALADDLGRFLAGEAVRARPTPAWERAAKWVKRRPALAALLALGVVSCVAAAGLVLVMGAWWRDAEARAKAVRQLDEAQQLLGDRKLELARLGKDVRQQQNELKGNRAELAGLKRVLPQERARVREARANVRRALYIRDMHLAQAALEKEDTAQLVMLLERHRPPPGEEDVRGFEWHYLWRLCHGARLALRGHTSFITLVRFAPDGRTVASFSNEEGFVRVWDAATGAALAPPWGRVAGVSSMAYSPDGTTFATGHQDGMVRLWDTHTGRARGGFRAHAGAVHGLAFARDSRALATGGPDGSAVVWDLATRQPRARFDGQGRPVRVELAPNGRALATWEDHTATLWDLTTGRERLTVRVSPSTYLPTLAFGPDGRILALGEAYPFGIPGGARVRFWEVATGKEQLPSLPVPNRGPWGLAFTPDGMVLAVGCDHGAVKLWDFATHRVKNVPTHKQRHTFLASTDRVHSVALSPDGKTLAAGGNDKIVRLWDLAAPDPPVVLEGLTYPHASFVAVAPDGKTLAMLNHGVLRLRDKATGRERIIQTKHAAEVNCLAFAPDGRALATGSWDTTIKLWDVATGKERTTLHGHASRVLGVVFSPDGRTLASCSQTGEIRLWDLRTGKATLVLHEPRAGSSVHWLAFDPGGRTLASGAGFGIVRLWDLAGGRLGATLRGTGGAGWDFKSVTFSPNGKLLAAGNWDGTIALWDLVGLERRLQVAAVSAVALAAPPPGPGRFAAAALLGRWTEKELVIFNGHTGAVVPVWFTADGNTLVSGHLGGAVKLWDVAMLQERFTLRCPANMPYSLALTPDGKALVAGGTYGQVYLWDGRAAGGRRWSFAPDPESPEQELARHRRAADEAEQTGQWFAAVWHLDRLIRRAPGSIPLLARRARAYVEMDNPGRALVDLSSLLERDPANAELRFQRGRALVARGQPDRALADFTEAVKRAPADAAAWLARSVTHARLGQMDEANATYAQAAARSKRIRLDPDGGWYWRPPRPGPAGLKHWQALARDLARLPNTGPDAWWIHRARGLAGAAQGQWLAAAVDFGKAGVKEPNDAESWYGGARASAELGQWPRVVNCCKQVARLEADDAALWLLRAFAEAQVQRFPQAAASYSRALTKGAAGWKVWAMRGGVFIRLGKWDEAAQDLAKARALSGAPAADLGGHEALVRLYAGDRKGYRKVCSDLLQHFGKANRPDDAATVAWACSLTPDAAADLAPLAAALERAAAKPNSFRYYRQRGAALYRTGQFEAAIRELQRDLRFNTDGTATLDWLFLAMAHHRLGHAAEAQTWLDKATQRLEQDDREQSKPTGRARLRWSIRLEGQLLRREAEGLLKKGKP